MKDRNPPGDDPAQDETVGLWDAASGDLIVLLAGHSGYVYEVAFSSDGTRVVSASADGSLRLWDNGQARNVVQAAGREEKKQHPSP